MNRSTEGDAGELFNMFPKRKLVLMSVLDVGDVNMVVISRGRKVEANFWFGFCCWVKKEQEEKTAVSEGCHGAYHGFSGFTGTNTSPNHPGSILWPGESSCPTRQHLDVDHIIAPGIPA
jgi:hypothetical protein